MFTASCLIDVAIKTHDLLLQNVIFKIFLLKMFVKTNESSKNSAVSVNNLPNYLI